MGMVSRRVREEELPNNSPGTQTGKQCNFPKGHDAQVESQVIVLVSCDSCNRIAHTWWLRATEMYSAQFWRRRNQVSNSHTLSRGGSRGALVSCLFQLLGLWLHPFNLCLCGDPDCFGLCSLPLLFCCKNLCGCI